MRTSSRILLIVAILSGTAILAGLGTWQVQRLQWKEALIAEVEDRRTQSPVSLAEMERRWQETGDVDYFPVRITGRYDHAFEQYFFTTHNGQVGWSVYTPMTLEDGRVILVNRGFVPDRMRDPATRPEGQVSGTVTVTGLARNPLYEKPGRFLPDNQPSEGVYYWKSIAQMARQADLEIDSLVPFFVDAGENDLPGGLPIGGTTIIAFPNNHLQYALTWYGLALALIGVGGYFLVASGRGRRA